MALKREEPSAILHKHTNNDLGIVGVIFGILSLFSLSAGGIAMGIIGLVFSMKQKKRNPNQWSKAGIILNWIGIVLGIVATIVIVTVLQDTLANFAL